MQQMPELQSKVFVCYRREYSTLHTVFVPATHHAQAVLMTAVGFRRCKKKYKI